MSKRKIQYRAKSDGDFMIEYVINENIALADTDAVVNSANGQGYMGGKRCIDNLHRGVSENIQFFSCGKVETLAKAECKERGGFFGFPPGTVFCTDAPLLLTRHIIHAVTMRFPGSKARIKTIEKLVPEILRATEFLNIETVSIPMLGCGTGGLSQMDVLKIFDKCFKNSKKQFYIYLTKQRG